MNVHFILFSIYICLYNKIINIDFFMLGKITIKTKTPNLKIEHEKSLYDLVVNYKNIYKNQSLRDIVELKMSKS